MPLLFVFHNKKGLKNLSFFRLLQKNKRQPSGDKGRRLFHSGSHDQRNEGVAWLIKHHAYEILDIVLSVY